MASGGGSEKPRGRKAKEWLRGSQTGVAERKNVTARFCSRRRQGNGKGEEFSERVKGGLGGGDAAGYASVPWKTRKQGGLESVMNVNQIGR